jgi:hypothetical protein
MHALVSTIALSIVLAASSAGAAQFGFETLADRGPCAGGCVDTWRVECPSSKTHRIEVRVRDLVDGQPNVYGVASMGFIGAKPLIGQSDREVSTTESVTFSIPAILSRPGNTDGPMKGFVLITQVSGNGRGYTAEFSCIDQFGLPGAGEPRIKLLQDR